MQPNEGGHSGASQELPRDPSQPYTLNTWKFHLGIVRATASKCAPFQRVRDLDGSSFKLIQTNARYNSPTRWYGIEIRTVTITLRRANRKSSDTYDLISSATSIRVWSSSRPSRELGVRASMVSGYAVPTKTCLFSFICSKLIARKQWTGCCYGRLVPYREMPQGRDLGKSRLQMASILSPERTITSPLLLWHVPCKLPGTCVSTTTLHKSLFTHNEVVDNKNQIALKAHKHGGYK